MKNPEFLPLDGQGEPGEESEAIHAPGADELPLTDWQCEIIDRRLDAYERDRNPAVSVDSCDRGLIRFVGVTERRSIGHRMMQVWLRLPRWATGHCPQYNP
jgi:hypothetical protein